MSKQSETLREMAGNLRAYASDEEVAALEAGAAAIEELNAVRSVAAERKVEIEGLEQDAFIAAGRLEQACADIAQLQRAVTQCVREIRRLEKALVQKEQ